MTASAGWRWNRFAAAAAGFVGFTGFTLVMPFLPLYFRELGVADVGEIALWTGLSLGVTPAMTAVLAPTWGRLADRFGLKLMVERSLLSFVVIMAATAFVTSAWHVLALRTLQGLFAGFGALTMTMAAESAPQEAMASSIGSVQTAQRLGPALGPIIGGAMAHVVGLRQAFLVAASFYALAFLLVLFLYRESSGPSSARTPEPGPRVTFRDVLAFQNFVVLMGVVFGLQFIDRSFGPILPLYVARLGTPLDRVSLVSGVLFSLAAGAAAAGHHSCSRLLKVFSARHVIAIAGGVGAGAVLAFGLATRLWLLLLVTPVFGLAVGVAMTAAYTVAGQVIPPRARGVGFGVLTTASLGGIALSPVFAGGLAAASLRAVFLFDAVAMAGLAWFVARQMVEPTSTR